MTVRNVANGLEFVEIDGWERMECKCTKRNGKISVELVFEFNGLYLVIEARENEFVLFCHPSTGIASIAFASEPDFILDITDLQMLTCE